MYALLERRTLRGMVTPPRTNFNALAPAVSTEAAATTRAGAAPGENPAQG